MPESAAFERVWRFHTLPGSRDKFEVLYGSEGAWAQLFARHPGFRGTELQRVPGADDEYMVVDRWESRLAWDEFRRDHAAEYEALDRQCESLTILEQLVRESDRAAP